MIRGAIFIFLLTLSVFKGNSWQGMSTLNGKKTIETLIHEALERNIGPHPFWATRELAAKDLGMTVQKVKEVIANDPELRARWGLEASTPPDEIAAMGKTVPSDVKRFSDVCRRENGNLKRELFERMGLSESEAQRMINGMMFSQEDFGMILQILNANLTVVSQKLQTMFFRHEARIEQVQAELITRPLDDETRGNLVMEEKSINDMAVATADQLQKIFSRVLEAAKLTAMVKQRLQNKPKRARPSFQEVGQGVEMEIPE